MESVLPVGLGSLGLLTQLILAMALVVANALFVASEFAIVKVRRTRLEELAGQGNARARLSLQLVARLDEYLSATQLGITLVSLGLGWVGEETFARLLVTFLPGQFAEEGSLHWIAATLSFLLITMLHVVMGELVPKSLAIQDADKIALRIARPLHFFYSATRPVIMLFTWLANRIVCLFGYQNEGEPPLSENELKLVMKESREDGVITESEAQIITRAFEFSDKRAGDIMVPASRVEYLSLARSFGENMQVIQRSKHSRFPLCRKGFETVFGIVHMKDAWPLLVDEFSNAAFERSHRPVIFVESAMRQDRIMKVFQLHRTELAIVQDLRTHATLGVVALTDVLEELVGELRDEHGA